MKVLKYHIDLRGAHVHESRIDEKELRQLSVVAFFSLLDERLKPHIHAIERQVKQSKAAWLKKDNARTKELVDVYFNQMTPLIFASSGRLLYPIVQSA